MTVPGSSTHCLARLKRILQDDTEAGEFEKLAAALVSDLTCVGIAVAATGFQHGGDAGPAGREGRRFRIEMKRYSDTTSLSNRELLGEVDHAITRDKALDGWFLVATREVTEQLELELLDKSEKTGIPIVVVDWKLNGFPVLAALCTSSPETVRKFAGSEAANLAQALKPEGEAALERLRREFAAWHLGFESVRTASHAHLERLWKDSRVALGAFGQNTAAGQYKTTVPRLAVSKALDGWWSMASSIGSPALVLGHEGAGKTWATVEWLAKARDLLPIVLAVPSSAFADSEGPTSSFIKQFLAERVHELIPSRNAEHWRLRLERLLKRPLSEGPVIALFLDGLNQQPTVDWQRILGLLQMPEFAGRVRVIVSTRRLHLEEKLGHLKALIDAPITVAVGNFDDSPGGELDQRLKAEGLTREDLHPALIPFARVPRLFALVVKFRERLVDAGQVTVHRLLWEYGRDTLGVRSGHSFSEQEWRDWLLRVAQDHLDGQRRYSLKALGDRAARSDLTQADVFRRLSDLIDAPFLKKSVGGAFELTPTIVHHALGAALLTTLDEQALADDTLLPNRMDAFLDSIAGLDERAEIVRAAVSIAVEREPQVHSEVVALLVAAWLTTQNVPEEHRTELHRIAEHLADPLLRLVSSAGGNRRAAQLAAVNALRAIPKDSDAVAIITRHTAGWFRQVPRGVDPQPSGDQKADKSRSDGYMRRIGTDRNGPHRVLGLEIELVERWPAAGIHYVAALLEGVPLRKAGSVFEALAVHHAVRGYNEMWDAMKWLVLLNPADYNETAEMLRSLAAQVRGRVEEPLVDKELKNRVAALLLWLTGAEEDEAAAASINPYGLYSGISYVRDYLSDPSASLFALEHRHARAALARRDVPIHRRIEKSLNFLVDPEFDAPAEFVADLQAYANSVDASLLGAERSSALDHHFERVAVALARCTPDQLAQVHRRKLESFATRSATSRFMSAVHAHESFILADERTTPAAKALRLSYKEMDEREEAYVTNKLLLLEIDRMGAVDQHTTIIEAAPLYVDLDLRLVLKTLTRSELERLIARYAGQERASRDLLDLLSATPTALEGDVWDWVLSFTGGDEEAGAVAFKLLYEADARRFGTVLLQRDWSWRTNQNDWVNHYGTLALAVASKGLPFEQVATRLAPWLLLAGVRVRGEDAREVEVAALIMDRLLVRTSIPAPEPGAKLFVNEDARANDPHSYSVLIEPEGETPLERLHAASDPEKYAAFRKRIVEKVNSRIEGARAAGASLYLRSFTAEDFRSVIRHTPHLVDGWLEGHEQRTLEFRRRVHLAEGAYLALCEALLKADTPRGVTLWEALRDVLTVSFRGRAAVDNVLQILLRAPDVPETTTTLLTVLHLDRLNTDSALLDLSLAASLNGRSEWLQKVINEDVASGSPWRKLRAQQMQALRVGNELPLLGGWTHGEMDGPTRRESDAARLRHKEACARYWWCRFWDAATEEGAFAAWILFKRAADRRAYAWINELMPADAATTKRKRLVHWTLNESELNSAAEEAEKALRSAFLGRKTAGQVHPWLTCEH